MPFKHLKFIQHWEVSGDTYYKLGQSKALIASLREVPLSATLKSELKQVSLIKGAQASTAIEGNTLSEEEVRNVLEGQNIPESKAYQEKEVDNILRAMHQIIDDVAIQSNPPILTAELFQGYHHRVGEGLTAPFGATPGKFAQSQRVVGNYRCPPPGRGKEQVEGLVKRLCEWSEKEFGFTTGKQTFRDGFFQAVISHVYFEWIHPFDDGNGRTGRLLEFYLLLRAGVPDICAHVLSNHYNKTRPEYYAHLQRCQETGELTDFIGYAITGFLDGLNEVWESISVELLERAWRSHVYDKFAEIKLSRAVLKRRRSLVLYLPLFKSHTFDTITLAALEIAQHYRGVEAHTIKRDIDYLVKEELLSQDESGEFSANVGILRTQYPQHMQM